MRYLLTKIRWDKNKDPRVEELIATVYLIGREAPIGQQRLPPNTDFMVLTLQDNSSYHINITSVMDGEVSSEALYSFDIPDLSTPLAVENFNWEITKVIEIDDNIFNQQDGDEADEEILNEEENNEETEVDS